LIVLLIEFFLLIQPIFIDFSIYDFDFHN
jgi:hypothetical protein